jgi:hypothetical protein
MIRTLLLRPAAASLTLRMMLTCGASGLALWCLLLGLLLATP